MPKRILLAEDEDVLIEIFTRKLKTSGFEVVAVQTATEARARLEQEHFDCAIIDMHLAEGTGEDVITSIKNQVPIIVISGYYDDKAIQTLNEKIFAVLLKPFKSETLLTTVNQILNTRNKLES